MDQISTDYMPFLFARKEDMLDDEFMVVPTSFEEPLVSSQLDEFLLESNFAGVTGTILSAGDVDQEINVCTNGGINSCQPDINHNSTFGLVSKYLSFSPHPTQGVNSHSSSDGLSNNALQAFGFDDLDFVNHDESNPDDSDGTVVQPVMSDVMERQLSELNDLDVVWLTEKANLEFIEKTTFEDKRQIQLLDELLRGDGDFNDVQDASEDYTEDYDDPSDDSMESSEILNEIYQEVQQLDFAVADDITSGGNEVPNQWAGSEMPAYLPIRQSRVQTAIAPKIAPARFHIADRSFGSLADHNFGISRRGRPPGSKSKRNNTFRREAVLKTKKRFQNREAALRYRLKKRAEKMEKEGELEQLLKRNQALKNEKYSLTAEVDYLRELLLEIKTLKGHN